MEPIPTAGRVFEQSRLVGPADVGPDGLSHAAAIADFLQVVAFSDARDAGLESTRAWVVRRTLMRTERRPRFGEELRIRTFCSGFSKSVAERRTSIEGDGGARVEAEAIWVQVHPETRMPSRFSEEFIAIYAEAAGGRRARSSLRHPPPPADPGGCERLQWSFRAADLDIAGHVNNAAYWQIAEEYLPVAVEPGEIEIEFRGGAGVGPATVLRCEGMLWVLDEAGETSASLTAAAR